MGFVRLARLDRLVEVEYLFERRCTLVSAQATMPVASDSLPIWRSRRLLPLVAMVAVVALARADAQVGCVAL